MKAKTVKAVVFDMDGVIFDTESVYIRAWIHEGKEYGVTDFQKIIPKLMGASPQKIKELFLCNYGADFPYDEYRSKVKNRTESIIQSEGLAFKSGAPEIFEFIRKSNIPVALATSTLRETAEEYLTKSGILKYFDCIVTGSDITLGKPNPQIYLKACCGLGVKPDFTMGIEDSFNGIRSVYNAGMIPVMVPDMLEPDEEISRLIYKKCSSLFDVIDVIQKCSL